MSREAHLEIVHLDFDPSAKIVDSVEGVPDHWQDYASTSEAQRLYGARLELRKLSDYFPKTAEALESIIVDAFLVHADTRGLCRVFMVQIKGETYLSYSRCPTAFCESTIQASYALLLERAPAAFSWVYQNLMDGLVDSYDLTGFVPSDRLKSMSEETAYLDFDWYDDFVAQHDPSKVVEFFSSGGGAYMLLDLNKDWKTGVDPQALRVSAKQAGWTPDNPVDFWPFLDAWMTIGLADG